MLSDRSDAAVVGGDDPLLDTKAVAALVTMAPGTVRYWRHVGRGPKWFRVGGSAVRYRRSEVARWLAEQEEAAASGAA